MFELETHISFNHWL